MAHMSAAVIIINLVFIWIDDCAVLFTVYCVQRIPGLLNYFCQWIRGLGGIEWRKRASIIKSKETVPLKCPTTIINIVSNLLFNLKIFLFKLFPVNKAISSINSESTLFNQFAPESRSVIPIDHIRKPLKNS